jgi:arginine/lysine/ornithine decarboxylase
MEKKLNHGDFLAKCSVCDSSLAPGNIVVVDENEQKSTLHVTCLKCNSAAMVFLSSGQGGIVSLGMATDLDADEVKEKMSREAISADEIIDLHQFVLSDKAYIVKMLKEL